MGKSACNEASVYDLTSCVPQCSRGGHTVLLVEDDPILLEITERCLVKAGYRVLAATTGAAALELWRCHCASIGLLISDVRLPGEPSGRQLAGLLQAQSPGLPVLFTSGYSLDHLAERGDALVWANFLQKPYRAAELVQAARERLVQSP